MIKDITMKSCPLCGAEALSWFEDPMLKTVSALYACDCQQTRRSEFVVAYEQTFRCRHALQEFKRSVPMQYRGYFGVNVDLNVRNMRAVEACLDFKVPQVLFLHGPPGVGKTHLSISAATEVILSGQSIRFITEQDLMSERRAAMFSNTDVTPLPSALVLDDIANSGRATEFYYSMFRMVLDEAIKGNRGLIITSNHSPEEAAERISPDPRNAQALISRLRAGRVVEVKGADRRVGSRA